MFFSFFWLATAMLDLEEYEFLNVYLHVGVAFSLVDLAKQGSELVGRVGAR